ncbi:MAG: hypothetical protein AB1640_03645 [bacterium]
MAKRLKKKARKAPRRMSRVKNHFGMAWYSAEQWPLLRDVSVDRDVLEETHSEWLAFAEELFAALTEKGISAVKVPVDVNELVAWCRDRGLRVDGAARADFAADCLRKAERKRKQAESDPATGEADSSGRQGS